MTKRYVVLLSGGLDSTVLCLWLQKSIDAEVLGLFVDRQQRAVREEQGAIEKLSGRLNLVEPLQKIRVGLETYRPLIPEKVREKKGIPGRNLVNIAAAVPFADLKDANCIAIGNNSSDNFPDCSPDFLTKLSAAIESCLQKKISLEAPFAEYGMGKAEVVRWAVKEGYKEIISDTFSCYFPSDGLHCGQCNGCVTRREAFHVAATCVDPTRYAA